MPKTEASTVVKTQTNAADKAPVPVSVAPIPAQAARVESQTKEQKAKTLSDINSSKEQELSNLRS